MAFVVTGNCTNKKHLTCLQVCPADCFHDATSMLVINPRLCINCGACVSVCSEKAIFREENLSEEDKVWIKFNAEMSETCPPIISENDDDDDF